MDEKIIKLVNDSEKELDKEFKKIDEICEYNSLKVLNAFWNNKLSEAHFSQTTGYGYDDIGRDVIEKIYAEILVQRMLLLEVNLYQVHMLLQLLYLRI